MFRFMLVAFASGSLATLPLGFAQDGGEPDPYTLDTCPVSGEKLGSMGEPHVLVHEGRQIKLCCKGCLKEFQKDSAAVLKKIDSALIEDQKKVYPSDKCLVTGEGLEEMGGAIDFLHRGRLVRFCCKGCIKKFNKDPKKFLGTLDKQVIDGQKVKYPLQTCVVSGKKLGSMGEPVDVVVANRLVRLCCKGCVGKLQKDPGTFLAKLRAEGK